MLAPASIRCGSKSARGSDDCVDRLSSLPDELLHRVMSFLPMPEIVRTSLLSPRWRYLWASTPFIRIEHDDFMDDNKLEKFGDRLLLLRDNTASLDEARIIAHGVDNTTCDVWIRHVIMHKVRDLHFAGSRKLLFTIGATMFPSQHLKRITLKYLLLRRPFIRSLDNDFPVLEHLELEHCCFLDMKEISWRSLKVLHIIRCFIGKDLLICASNLTHLSILDPVRHFGAMVTRNLSSLVTASISLRSDVFHYELNPLLDHDLLDGLSHATTLELHAPLPELTFERELRTCPVFSNLTSLVLGDWCTAADFYPLHRILHRSPKLKELSFKLEMEECRKCKELESALPSSRAVADPPLGRAGAAAPGRRRQKVDPYVCMYLSSDRPKLRKPAAAVICFWCATAICFWCAHSL